MKGTISSPIGRGWRVATGEGFTLAEVLITLGIIGIVAAMTLPTIVQQNQKKVVATRLKQTYSQLYQAINMAQADYGDMKNWDVNDNYGNSSEVGSDDRFSIVEKFAKTYLQPYLKYNGTPGTYPHYRLGYSAYVAKNGQTYLGGSSQSYIIQLANGVTLFIAYNGNGTVMTLPIIWVDINGKTKPNVVGRDFFMFSLDSISSMKVIPSGYGLSRERLINHCSKDASDYKTNLFCTALIMHDGWEIKKDYPW